MIDTSALLNSHKDMNKFETAGLTDEQKELLAPIPKVFFNRAGFYEPAPELPEGDILGELLAEQRKTNILLRELIGLLSSQEVGRGKGQSG